MAEGRIREPEGRAVRILLQNVRIFPPEGIS